MRSRGTEAGSSDTLMHSVCLGLASVCLGMPAACRCEMKAEYRRGRMKLRILSTSNRIITLSTTLTAFFLN